MCVQCLVCLRVYVDIVHPYMGIYKGRVVDVLYNRSFVIRHGLCHECKFAEDALISMRTPFARFKCTQ